jgi:hypothetical protein
MMRRFALLLIAGFLLLAPGSAARADDASLGRSGETVFPIGEPSVRMADETVLLTIGREKTAVDLTFTFANDGPARDVLMGFPLEQRNEGPADLVLHDFKTWVDGTPATVAQQAGAPAGSGALTQYPGWMTWSVPFAAGQTRTVTNSYWGKNMFWSNGDATAGYILKTGATWQGPIGHALVKANLVDLLPSDLFRIEPATYRWEGGQLVWEWRDVEPTRDIAVYWNGRENPEPSPVERDVARARQLYLADSKPEALALVKAALDAGDKSPTAIYLAVAGGLKPATDFLDWDLGAVIKRWLQDQAGVSGTAPATPVIAFSKAEPPYIPSLDLTLHDPDGDIDDWGLKLWLMQDESVSPVLAVGNDGAYRAEGTRPLTLPYQVTGWITQDEVWAQAWVADGRGHRQETGWVKLAVPTGLKPPEARGVGSGGSGTPAPGTSAPPSGQGDTPGPAGQPPQSDQRLPWPLAVGVVILLAAGVVAYEVIPTGKRGA